MKSLNALFLTPKGAGWLANSRHPRILHVFDNACNLIDERGEVLSIVTPQIGNGPFNLVVEHNVCFSNCITLQSPVSKSSTRLALGDLAIKTGNAKRWSPQPDWGGLHAQRDIILDKIVTIRTCLSEVEAERNNPLAIASITNYQSLVSNLSSALACADISSALTITSQLAGLGAGLTPAGDDCLLGALLAVWIIHPLNVAMKLAKEITDTAAPLTNSLSAAWLRSAGRGEAGILWHYFFRALTASDPSAIQLQIIRLLSIGHTSGADALAGFIGTLSSWAELTSLEIH